MTGPDPLTLFADEPAPTTGAGSPALCYHPRDHCGATADRPCSATPRRRRAATVAEPAPVTVAQELEPADLEQHPRREDATADPWWLADYADDHCRRNWLPDYADPRLCLDCLRPYDAAGPRTYGTTDGNDATGTDPDRAWRIANEPDAERLTHCWHCAGKRRVRAHAPDGSPWWHRSATDDHYLGRPDRFGRVIPGRDRSYVTMTTPSTLDPDSPNYHAARATLHRFGVSALALGPILDAMRAARLATPTPDAAAGTLF